MSEKTVDHFDDDPDCICPEEGTLTWRATTAAYTLLQEAYRPVLGEWIPGVRVVETFLSDIDLDQKSLHELYHWIGRRIGMES